MRGTTGDAKFTPANNLITSYNAARMRRRTDDRYAHYQCARTYADVVRHGACAVHVRARIRLLTACRGIGSSGHEQVSSILELEFMYAGLALLWPVFVAEAIWGLYQRDRSKPRRPIFLGAAGRAHAAVAHGTNRSANRPDLDSADWLAEAGQGVVQAARTGIRGPMVLFAFLILPVLLLNTSSPNRSGRPGLGLALDVGIAVIWVAFATEFIFKASAHPKPIRVREGTLAGCRDCGAADAGVRPDEVGGRGPARAAVAGRRGRSIPSRSRECSDSIDSRDWRQRLGTRCCCSKALPGFSARRRRSGWPSVEEKIAELEEEIARTAEGRRSTCGRVPSQRNGSLRTTIRTSRNSIRRAAGSGPGGTGVIASNRPSAP